MCTKVDDKFLIKGRKSRADAITRCYPSDIWTGEQGVTSYGEKKKTQEAGGSVKLEGEHR